MAGQVAKHIEDQSAVNSSANLNMEATKTRELFGQQAFEELNGIGAFKACYVDLASPVPVLHVG